MKKSIKLCVSGTLFIAGLFPLTLLAQPKAGDFCSGLTNYKYNHTCSISLAGEDNSKVYTYAITYMNVGNKVGFFYPHHLPSSMVPDGTPIGPMIAPGKTSKMITDSHFCTEPGAIKLSDLAILGTAVGWDQDFIQMQITEVSVIKTSPISAMRCAKLNHNMALIEQ